ncbi:J domain-containing protein [Haloarcula sp. S1CR25-12]|uniref:J domain-containing protein n=1 Tax=Haloarcula saliterrae TaxID=2950534 RepID=A0ABU2FGT7_9EURY|nr:hypothetical protein [Haloarcula sp. S1CR25-12]MDS0261055.1 J domain-containing protein [Haloarcula sp. S1CR25-12]
MDRIDVEDATPNAGDYYSRIAAAPDFSAEELQNAADAVYREYQIRARTGDESDISAQIQRVKDAREVLTDPELREQYDIFHRAVPSSRADAYENWQKSETTLSPNAWLRIEDGDSSASESTSQTESETDTTDSSRYKYDTSSPGKSSSSNDSSSGSTSETNSGKSRGGSTRESEASTDTGSERSTSASSTSYSQGGTSSTSGTAYSQGETSGRDSTGGWESSTTQSAGSNEDKTASGFDESEDNGTDSVELTAQTAVTSHLMALVSDGVGGIGIGIGVVIGQLVWVVLAVIMLIAGAIISFFYGILNWFVELLTPISIAVTGGLGSDIYNGSLVLLGVGIVWLTGAIGLFIYEVGLSVFDGDDTDELGSQRHIALRWSLVAVPLVPLLYFFGDLRTIAPETLETSVLGGLFALFFLARVVTVSLDRLFFTSVAVWLAATTTAIGSAHVLLFNMYWTEIGEEFIRIWQNTGLPSTLEFTIQIMLIAGAGLFVLTEVVRGVDYVRD